MKRIGTTMRFPASCCLMEEFATDCTRDWTAAGSEDFHAASTVITADSRIICR